jgi:hypothetical protein
VNIGNFGIFHDDRTTGTGEHALGAIGAATVVDIGRLIQIDLKQGMRLAYPPRQARIANLA